MLISRAELDFDFKGAQFDPDSREDRALLGWVFNQFLYGEVTGIQCGYWLYRAPTLQAASFLAKQAGEELSHVRKILRILSRLGEPPAPAHWAIRFLSTGLMGHSWGEHVALEMALGEGLVLGVFYAMARTIPQPEIRKILESAIIEEESHVEFGERETRAWISERPESRGLLLGLALVQLWTLSRLRKFVVRKLAREADDGHPVLSQFEAFYAHQLKMFSLRIDRLGLSARPLEQLGATARLGIIAAVPFRMLWHRLARKPRLLTSRYLDDPALRAESQRFHSSSIESE